MLSLNAELVAFAKVVECGSFNKAAEALYLSPSAVVKQVKAFEEKTGIVLFERSPKGVVPTEAGEIFYRDAVALLGQWEKAVTRARDEQGRCDKTVRVGTSPLYNPAALIELWKKVPCGDAFTLEMVPFTEVEDAGAHRALGSEYDVIVGPTDALPLDGWCKMLKLDEWRFAVALPASHPLAGRDMLSLEDLAGERLMMMERGCSVANDRLRQDILDEGIAVQLIEAPRFYHLKAFNDCARSGSLLLSLDGWSNVHPMLASVPLDVSYRLPFGVMYAANSRAVVREFIDYLEEARGEG